MILEVDFTKALSNFTLSVQFHSGEGVTALLGASGCGKSMTLKCIAGIEKPDRGRIALNGRVLFDSQKKICLPPQKRRVGYMFQDYALFPNMTVRQNVMTGMGKKPDPALVSDYLARFHIADCAEEYPGTLSGGQKQRAALARLMAMRPEAILLDEPFSALDSYLKWQLEREMKLALEEAGCPVVFVTHDRDEVYHLASQVCCMDRGKNEPPRPLHEFFREPGTRAAAMLSGCKNISPVTAEDIKDSLSGADEAVEDSLSGADKAAADSLARTAEAAKDSLSGTADAIKTSPSGAAEALTNSMAGTAETIVDSPAGTVRSGGAGGISSVEVNLINWGIRFPAGTVLPPGTAYAGIRAHHFHTEPRGAADLRLPVLEPYIQEDPFEWTLFFKAAPGMQPLQWKVSKQEQPVFTVPEALYLSPDDIMYLK